MSQPSRERRYRRLIRLRRADTSLAIHHFINPAETPYEPRQLGSFGRWAGDLYADLVVILTDWRCLAQFEELRGEPACCKVLPDSSLKWVRPANGFLLELLKSIDRDIGTPDDPKPAGVFLADAVPFIGMGEAGKHSRIYAYRYCAGKYILPLLDIINPKTVICMGAGPTDALFHLLEPDTSHVLPDLDPTELATLVYYAPFKIRSGQTALFPVFHPAYINQHKRRPKHKNCSQVKRFN